MRRFVEITHETYRKRVGAEFGKTVPAIFTDEPQFSFKEALRFAKGEQDVSMPWTNDFDDSFRAAYGYSILDKMPEVFFELGGGAVSQARYHFHDHVAERFVQAFADTLGAWCDQNGILLTGHVMEEPTLSAQSRAVGDAMRSYRSFSLPGIDMLSDRHEYTTAKQAQSAVHQKGDEGMMSELYGVTTWDFDFRGHKLYGDWQAALGFADIVHQGLPFYSGKLSYHFEVETSGGALAVTVPRYRAATLRIGLDGESVPVAFSPYTAHFSPSPGVHHVTVEAFIPRTNGFGPLHNCDESCNYQSPGAWRTRGDEWSYEYCFAREGLLAAPRFTEYTESRGMNKNA